MPSLLLLFSYVLLGCCALIVQVICIREILVVFYGNELCLGVVFACWLVGVAVGAGMTARIVDRLRQTFQLYLSFVLLLCVLFPTQIFCIRILRDLLQVPPGEFIPLFKLFLGSFGTITPFSFFIGALFPVACRLFPKAGSQHIGRVYIAEAIGSILGGVIFTFLLVIRYNAFQIATLAGSLMLLMTVILSIAYDEHKQKFMARRIGGIALALSLFYGYMFFSSSANNINTLTIEERWQSMHQEMTLIKSVDSRYENLALGFQADQYALFANGQYAAVFPDEYSAAITAHFYMTEHPHPCNVLLIGGGAEGLIGEILKHPISRLDYVELDPKLLDLLSAYLPSDAQQALSDQRVSIIYADGRYYVKRTDQHYDMVILNIPDPTNAMLNRFYTLEFFQEVQRILNPGGVLVTQLSSSLHLQEDAANYTGSIYKTLHKIFPHVLVTPGTVNIYFATSEPNVLTFDTEILSKRYLERNISSDYFSEYHYDTLLQAEQIVFVETILQKGVERFRINTDFQPTTYFYSLLLWTQFSETTPERQAGSFIARMFHSLKRLHFCWFFLPIAVFTIIRIGYTCLKYRTNDKNSFVKAQTRFNCLWAIGTTGFAGMALELILIFAFQNIYGYIYQKAGLIVAVFMVGLAAGGYASHTMVGTYTSNPNFQDRKLLSWLFRFEIAIVVFAAGFPGLTHILSSRYLTFSPIVVEIIFMLLVGISGVLTGVEFPLASAIYLHNRGEVGKTAGMVDSADHIGAFCGSLLTGIFFVPLLGIAVSCYFVSALNLSSVVFLLKNDRDFP